MTRLRMFGSFVLALLRELSDESAYQRYLAIERRKPSAEEWRKFCETRLHAKYFRPKCC
jgi:hypothetical protein